MVDIIMMRQTLTFGMGKLPLGLYKLRVYEFGRVSGFVV